MSLLDAGVQAGRLSAGGREVFRHFALASLDGTLPPEPHRLAALDALLDRIDPLIGSLPTHAQRELAQLLSLVNTVPGRRLLVGLQTPWQDASIEQIQAALQSMRTSPSLLRQQAYHALHDITGAAYFSDRSTWAVLGYPGPLQL